MVVIAVNECRDTGVVSLLFVVERVFVAMNL